MAPPSDIQPITSICPEPVKHPLMLQAWTRLTFLHWRYDPDIVRRLLPPGLVLDTYDGSAWIGLVPFEVRRLTLPGVPPLPWLSHFPETNVRTYAIGPDGSRGVWFFSLDAARVFAVAGARLGYGLPYFWAHMSVRGDGIGICYRSARRSPRPAYEGTRIRIVPLKGRCEASERDAFLTGRFRLFSFFNGALYYAPIEHQPWPLQQAEVAELRETLVSAAGLPAPKGEALVHYATSVHVRVGAIQRF